MEKKLKDDGFGYEISYDLRTAALFMNGVLRAQIILPRVNNLEYLRDYIFEFRKILIKYS